MTRLSDKQLKELCPAEALASMRGNKYGARRTWSELCQREFPSKGQAEYADQLMLRQKAGDIYDVRFDERKILSTSPRIAITIDFHYWSWTENGKEYWEDYKGVLTRDTRTKLAWLREKYGIEVRLIYK